MMGTKMSVAVLCAALMGTAAASAQEARRGKQVIIDKERQELQAFQDGQLVFRSNVSTGRPGHNTPNGHYSVQDKERMHYSRLYDNAPMPYSVRFCGNYFIHGFGEVPDYPASHGCVRLPEDVAREFFEWVDCGTPVRITGQWTPKPPTTPVKKPGFWGRMFGRL